MLFFNMADMFFVSQKYPPPIGMQEITNLLRYVDQVAKA